MFTLEGKVAIVTGASRGIGKATALLLARLGASVAVVSLADDNDHPRDVAAEIQALEHRAIAFDADVSDYEAARSVVDSVVRDFGAVDILVNNAGMSQPLRLLELTEADWDRTLAVNLKSVFNWTQAVVPNMLDRGWGRIVNVSSISAKSGGGGPPKSVSRSAYAASKGGVLGFTRALALELGPAITVNAICPGPIQTKLTESIMGGSLGDARGRAIPAGRIGVPEDVAHAIAFLCLHESSFITGEVIDVAGGSYID
jgi:3-oxoacyl-[acyl-carrier protein] reductase